MPRIHDPALHTPERRRAVAALHWLGLFQLLYVFVFVVASLFALTLDLQDTPLPPFNAPLILLCIIFLSIFVFPQAIAGIAAIAGTVMICKGRRWGRALGWVAIIISAICFSMGWLFLLLALFGNASFNASLDPPVLYFPLAFYVCVGSVLTVLAVIRCWRCHATEPAAHPERSGE